MMKISYEWICGLALVVEMGCGSISSQKITQDGGFAGDATIDGYSSDAISSPDFLSCHSLPSTCGASSSDDCCTSLAVPGGSYDRTYDAAGIGDTSAPATVSSFRLDKYEVTVGRFRAFINAGMGTQAAPPPSGAGVHPNIAGSGWDAAWNANLAEDEATLIGAIKCDAMYQTWTDAAAANEHRPINCITWYEALAFCIWDGGYLPTEAEWNYAAVGGDQQRAYPWSSPPASLTLDGTHASYFDGSNCVGDGTAGCALTDVISVGIKPAGDGRWGQSDLAGNVYEWMLDWYAPYTNPCVDCADLTSASLRGIRGGAFDAIPIALRGAGRFYFGPAARHHGVGIRCARVP